MYFWFKIIQNVLTDHIIYTYSTISESTKLFSDTTLIANLNTLQS